MLRPGVSLRLGRRRLVAGAGAFLGSPAIVRAQPRDAGVALVIGNSKYKWEASLPNVRRDALDVAKAFQALGLKTELVQDVGRDAMRAAVEKFAGSARGANLAAFYFAGHGASWDADTYLVPEDADLANPRTVQTLLPVTAVGDAMKAASHRLLVFDNCRNNPADGWRQRAAVIASRITSADQVAASFKAPNTLVLYSTAPGRTALDGPAGENSPFAAAFLRQLGGPSNDLATLSSNLRRDLLIATGGRQVLWDQNTYMAPFPLSVSRGRPSPGVNAPPRDPANVLELANAYAFAREKNLLLPAGLVALRMPDGSSHAHKIGSFHCITKVRVGGSITSNSASSSLEPLLLVVLTVPKNDTAEIIISTRDWYLSGGKGWRYISASLSGSRLKYDQIVGSRFGLPIEEFAWKDENSGIYNVPISNSEPIYHSRFTRLDG